MVIDWILPASNKLEARGRPLGTVAPSAPRLSSKGNLSPIGVLVKAGQGTLVLLGAVQSAALGARYQPCQLSHS